MDRILPMHSVGFCKLPGGGGIDDRRGSCPDSVSGGAPPARQSSLDSVLSISRALRGLQFSWDTKQLLTREQSRVIISMCAFIPGAFICLRQ